MANHHAMRHLDSVVRFSHWVIVISFFMAYFTGDSDAWHTVHLWAGYTLAISLAFRLLWQMVGKPFYRPFGLIQRGKMAKQFFKLIRQPKTPHDKIRYGLSMLLHSGIVVMTITMALTVFAGYATENLAHSYKDIHEFLANGSLILVGIHIAAVLCLSLLMKKWLVLSLLKILPLGKWAALFILLIVTALSYFAYGFFHQQFPGLQSSNHSTIFYTKHHQDKHGEDGEEDHDDDD